MKFDPQVLSLAGVIGARSKSEWSCNSTGGR
jgi:hypothetical protein